MNYKRLSLKLLVVWASMIGLFFFSLECGEAFYLTHGVWLLIAAVVIIFLERKRYQKDKEAFNTIR